MPQEYRLILKHVDQPGYTPDLACYLRHGGYQTLKKALALPPRTLSDGKVLTGPEQIRKDVLDSGLRGRGGAGFSCGLKWSFVDHRSGKPVYLICNADESEPGTFKDRQILHKDPHQLLEGMILSGYANGVHLAYIYIRGEFVEGARLLERALAEAREHGYLGRNILGSGYDLEIHVHRGAGAYICGEETGLIESLEGKRPYPRIKPPYFPAVLGLYLCPTIVNNVETLCAVKHVVALGGSEYARLGTPNNTGTRIVSLSGHLKRPGYYEIEVGKVTLGQLILDPAFGGGLRDGHRLKAIIPGGSSAKVFRAGEKFQLQRRALDGTVTAVEVDLLDLPYDFDSLQQAGSMSGSGAIIVLDDTTDMVEALANIAEFYAHESCGQCTPCREGSLWLSKALHRMTHGRARLQDAEYLLHIARNIQGRTVCAFGEACAWPVMSFITKFRAEFDARGAADAAAAPPASGPPGHPARARLAAQAAAGTKE
jgi:NADH-quinone oxidoreductase subunit F